MPSSSLRRRLLEPAREWLGGDVPALPVDLFRLLVGLLAGSWFLRLLIEFPLISHPSGLIDHALVQRLHPLARVSLFQAGIPAWVLAAAYGIGLLAALAIVVGARVRVAAAVAFVVAASAYRWNFVVMYLDDAVVHLLLFWLLLLPTGRTLTLAGWRNGPSARRRWIEERVPGTAVRCLLVNVCWIYFIAGAWKLDSGLWQEGLGLYASLKVDVARLSHVWGPDHLPALRAVNYVVMVAEPVLPLAVLAPRGRALRYLGAAALVSFNGFILVSMGIEWAILGLTATLVLFLGEEITDLLGRGIERPEGGDGRAGEVVDPGHTRRWTRAERLSVAFLAVLMLATARHIPVFGALNVPAHAALWTVGVAQDYRLFNWVDRVAYDVQVDIDVRDPEGRSLPPPDGAWPTGFRVSLLRGYAHNVPWLILPVEETFGLRLSIVRRHASWFCRFVREAGTEVEIVSTIRPLWEETPEPASVRRMRFARFECVEPGTVEEVEGGVSVPEAWPHLQARLLQGLNPVP